LAPEERLGWGFAATVVANINVANILPSSWYCKNKKMY